MKTLAALMIGAASIALPMAWTASAGATETCHTSKVAVTHLVKVREKVDGKWKTVEKREDVKVKERVKETVRVKVDGKYKTETKIVTKLVVKYRSVKTCTTSAITTTPTVTAPSPVVALAASIDPSYTQSGSDPYEVTWSYSASAQETSDGITQDDSSLPDGVLELYSDGSLVQSSDVGGATTSANATVTYAAWGNHTIDVVYDSGTSSGTTGNEGFDIEPPAPQALVESWGTSSPSEGPSISATVSADETSDDVTSTDPNFEGAQSVTLTDDNGNTCTATVSGTTAQCTMDNTATPTSFTVGYPGGTTTTQTIDPYGVDQSQSVEWPSEQVAISGPSVTVPSTTDVTDTIPDIDAYAVITGSDCGTIPDPDGYECFEMGVQWTGADSPPSGGVVTLTATAENETSGNEDTASCTVDLSSATTCYTLYDSEPGLPNLTSGDWSIAATYSGFDNGEYDATDWAAITTPVNYTMTYASGSWYDYQGSGS